MTSTQVQIDYDVHESDEENFLQIEKVSEKKENGSPLDEVISELQKVGSTADDMGATLSLRSFGRVVQSAANEEERLPKPNEVEVILFSS